jgi:cbb3-type cytochrome oxidase maturation protein
VNVLILQIFVSLMLVAAAVALFVWTVRSRTFEHADRLALAPLEDDTSPVAGSPASFSEEESA